MVNYQQKILFGGPGVGKSHMIQSLLNELHVDVKSENYVPTIFHPEYTYGDFMGKLLPLTKDGKVTYEYYAGHFLKSLAQAFKNILLNPQNPKQVALVIDEINRGNSSAIFGTIFQLLDRDSNGWSCYKTNISTMEFIKILEIIGIEKFENNDKYLTVKNKEIQKHLDINKDTPVLSKEILDKINITNFSIKIPSNLSIIATMNTSDNSIFYMDSAFKRRWDWEFITVEKQRVKIEGGYDWPLFIDKVNKFILKNHKSIRQIEDKQIGYWFIKPRFKEYITKEEIKNKLMFFLWDSVFGRDKSCLVDLLNIEREDLITFKHFSDHCDTFIKKIATS